MKNIFLKLWIFRRIWVLQKRKSADGIFPKVLMGQLVLPVLLAHHLYTQTLSGFQKLPGMFHWACGPAASVEELKLCKSVFHKHHLLFKLAKLLQGIRSTSRNIFGKRISSYTAFVFRGSITVKSVRPKRDHFLSSQSANSIPIRNSL